MVVPERSNSDAGVVDQNVEGTELGKGLFEDPLGVLGTPDIGDDRQHRALSVEIDRLFGDGIKRCLIDIDQGQPCSLLGEACNHGPSQAPTGTRDDHHFAAQVFLSHRFIPA